MNEVLSIDEIANFFDRIKERNLIEIFDYTYKDGETDKTIGIKEAFKAYHAGKWSRYSKNQMELAWARFWLIWSDNSWEVLKIVHEKELLTELINIEKNWQNVTAHKYDNSGTNSDHSESHQTNENTDARGLITGTLRGNVDASQFKLVDAKNLLDWDKNKVLGYLDPNSKEREHLINIEGGKNITSFKTDVSNNGTSRTSSKGNSTTSSSNASEDIRVLLNTTIPQLRNNLLSKFNVMFKH